VMTVRCSSWLLPIFHDDRWAEVGDLRVMRALRGLTGTITIPAVRIAAMRRRPLKTSCSGSGALGFEAPDFFFSGASAVWAAGASFSVSAIGRDSYHDPREPRLSFFGAQSGGLSRAWSPRGAAEHCWGLEAVGKCLLAEQRAEHLMPPGARVETVRAWHLEVGA